MSTVCPSRDSSTADSEISYVINAIKSIVRDKAGGETQLVAGNHDDLSTFDNRNHNKTVGNLLSSLSN